MNVLIPMAGAGSRFQKQGYQHSKPLIDVHGLPMIVRVIDNIGLDATYNFIVRNDLPDYNRLYHLLSSIKPDARVITLKSITQGAAETCLLASSFINNDEPLLIANCDQLQEWDPELFQEFLDDNPDADGVIVTFTSTDKNNSYAKVNAKGRVVEVAEKVVISDLATTGVYYWRRGKDFVSAAQKMIEKNIRTRGEFYVCPVYNETIAEGKNVICYHIPKHWPIGTPEDLNHYLVSRQDGR